MAIHPTAIVPPGAEIDRTCEIGPFAVIGPRVKMGPRCTVGPHAVVDGETTLGAENRIFPFASVGCLPQDLKYRGEATSLVVGDRNQFREYTTVSIGTAGGGGVTRIGSGCLLMATSHVAHDVQLGDGCILANAVALAGHVAIEDHVTLGGLSGVHQFTRIGRFAFASGGSLITQDVPPYCIVQGDRAELVGLNVIGLQRGGFTEEQIARIKEAYRITFRSKLGLRDALAQLREQYGTFPEIAHFVSFLEKSERGPVR